MKKGKLFALAAGVLATALTVGCSGSESSAKSDADGGTLEGKTVEFIVPFSPGGGYDTYARMIAPKLEEELGATVVVVNKPGAGGMLATNELWNTKPDGLTFAMFNTVGHIGSALAEAEGVQYEAEEFSYLARVSREPDVVVTKANGPLSSWDDVIAADAVRFGASGPGSLEYVDAVVLQLLDGVEGEVVTGFEGSSEVALAVLAGDVDLHALSMGSQMSGIESGDTNPLLVIGAEEVPELEGVPSIMDYVSGDNENLIATHTRLLETGRVLAAPPGTDEGVLEELRSALETVLTDEEFIAEAEEAGRPLDFASGEEVQALVEELMDSPAEYVDVLKQAYLSN